MDEPHPPHVGSELVHLVESLAFRTEDGFFAIFLGAQFEKEKLVSRGR